MPTFGSLFSGIGGMDLGLERAGWHVRWQVEIDEYCQRVLAKHWPDVPRYRDVREVGDELGQVDLIAGGFPCQPVANAGKRLAQQDERWLWPEFARIIRVVRPRYVLLENVPGLLARGFGDVLGDLAELGFDAEWSVLPAAAFGAPHLRWRVFVVAYSKGDRCEAGRTRGEQEAVGALVNREPECRRAPLDNADCRRHRTPQSTIFPGWFCPQPESWWETEPDVGRVADGVPARVDRLRGLGNAVVPQVAEYLGRLILESGERR